MKNNGLSSAGLKLTAYSAMLIDHIGAFLIWPVANAASGTAGTILSIVYYTMRGIGRIAFPIFTFMLAEGLRRTHNLRRYMLRIGVLALISEIPFDLANNMTPFDWSYQSVCVTLLCGLIAISAIKAADENISGKGAAAVVSVTAVALCFTAAELLACDYGGLGILLPVFFYVYRGPINKKIWIMMAIIVGYEFASTFWLSDIGPFDNLISRLAYGIGSLELAAVFALIPLSFYSGEKGRLLPRAAYYLFYPVHFMIIWGIAVLVF